MTEEQDPRPTTPFGATPAADPYGPPPAVVPTVPTDPYAPVAQAPVADPYAPALDPSEPAEPAARTPRTPRLSRPAVLVPLVTVLALLAGLVGGAIGYGVAEDRSGSSSLVDSGAVLGAAGSGSSARPDDSIAGIASRVLPTVVSIGVETGDGGGTGSGFVVKDGYVLTNNHVIADAVEGNGTITVTYADGRSDDAQIVGRDTSYDLAVLKVDRTGLDVATLGNSDNAVVGDTVVAVGSPLGLQGTVTSGIVSAKNRPVTTSGNGTAPESFINAIQTDAAINPGNSGGPLVDSSAAVIGVNSAIASLGTTGASSQSGSIGLGFAIPINQARRVAEEIIRTGTSSHPIIGASVDSSYEGPGARIATESSGGTQPITPGGPADKAGLKAGDVVLEVDGRPVNGAVELIVAIRSHAPGDTVELTLKDGDGERTIKVTLGSQSGD